MHRIAGQLLPQSDKSILRLCCCYLNRNFLRNENSFCSIAGQHVFEPVLKSTPVSVKYFSVSNVEGLCTENNILPTLSHSESNSSQDHDTDLDQQRNFEKAPTRKIKYDTVEAFSTLASLVKDSDANARLKRALDKEKDAESQLVKMIEAFESQHVASMGTGALLSSLKSLNTLLGSAEAGKMFLVKNMENALMWRSRTMPMRDLTNLLSFSVKYRPTDVIAVDTTTHAATESRTLLYKEVIRSLERRWVEIVEARSFVGVLHYPECFTEQYLLKLEDRMTELAETLSTSDLVLILKDLALKKRRSVPLLRSLSYHLMRNREELDLRAISDCLFALKQLSFKDTELLEVLCSAAAAKMSNPCEKLPLILRSILTSVGQIRFRSKELLDEISAKLMENEEDLDNRDLLAFIVTTASLNYTPKNSDQIYLLAMQRLTQESFSSEPTKKELLWLDVVWSLSVLKKANEDHLKSVLSAEFYNKVLYSNNHRNVGIILKLLNINAVAQHLESSYRGPLIVVADDPLIRDVKLPVKNERAKLVSTILESFEGLAAAPNFLATDVNTMMGFHLDGEVIFDGNMKPLHLSEYETFMSKSSSVVQPTSSNFKPIPKNATRVAVLVVGFHDCLVNNTELSGLTNLCVRLLKANSYKTLLVRHDDFKPQHKQIERVKILEKKLKDLLAV